MFVLSAFADEISPDPLVQLDVLEACGIKHVELRSVHSTNVLALTDTQVAEFKALLDARGFGLSAVGSPVGKSLVGEPFGPVLQKFERAIHLCGVFGTPNVRVFSFYKPVGDEWEKWRGEVLTRLQALADRAADAGVRLLHENEHNIYGDSPDRVVDLLENVKGPAFHAVYDPANYVFCGYDPWEGWQRTKGHTTHFHIKDWTAGDPHARLAGEGQGRIPEVLKEATAEGYEGYATLEPHLLGGGPTGGVTGPELFPKAAEAMKRILDEAGAAYR